MEAGKQCSATANLKPGMITTKRNRSYGSVTFTPTPMHTSHIQNTSITLEVTKRIASVFLTMKPII